MKLNLRSGKLWRSLSPNAPSSDSKSIFKIDEFGGFQYEIESLLPYAQIHDTGGFIKATPISVIYYKKDVEQNTPIRKSTYLMAQYFWAQYFKSKMKNQFFKIMAFSVQKLGGVNIKQTNYFRDSVAEFKKTDKKNVETLVNNIVEMINKNEEIDITLIAKEFKEHAEMIPFDFSIAVANNLNRLSSKDAKRLNNVKTATWK